MSHFGTSFVEPSQDSAMPPLHGNMRRAPHALLAVREPVDAQAEGVAVICHELRNCLAVIRGAARLLRHPEASDAQNASRLIERQVVQMSRHIEDLLQPTRRNGAEPGLRLARIDLRNVARFALDALDPEMCRRRHRVAIKLPAEPVWVRADAARLEQVLTNLLINAAKYTPDGGDISLVMEREKDGVQVRIRDSGVGIEAAMLPRVFGMFFQVCTDTSGAERGRGIGLAVVRAIVEQHGGTVTAASAGLCLGSEFTIVLPVLWAQPDSLIVVP